MTSGPSFRQPLNVSPFSAYRNLISRRIDYLQLSPAIQKYLLQFDSITNYLLSSIIVNCDWATRTTTSSYSLVTYASTQTSLLVYLGLEQSPANP